MLPADEVDKKLERQEIEVAPLAYMRGRTLAHAVVILDEAQNTTPMQMKMFLTRLGEGSRMVINGDLSQTDLPRGVQSGLADAIGVLKNIDDIKIIQFSEKDVVRHGLVSKIVKAYDARNKEQNNA
jgi:phosphate starvation-inducible PhoH-like protein